MWPMKIPSILRKSATVGLLLLATGLLSAGLLMAVNAHPGQAAIRRANAETVVVDREVWRSGYTVAGDAHLAKTSLQHMGITAAMRSNGGAKDIYFVIAEPAQNWTIEDAAMNPGKVSGSYPLTATVSLEVLSMAGDYLRSLTSRDLNVQYAAGGKWKSFNLVDEEERQISPGEMLAFHFRLGGEPGGDLEIYPVFEVSAVMVEGQNPAPTPGPGEPTPNPLTPTPDPRTPTPDPTHPANQVWMPFIIQNNIAQ